MAPPGDTCAFKDQYPGLHMIDGTDSRQSYVVVARRGNIFLGIRFLGLADGSEFGIAGKTYLYARVRSARNQSLAEQLDKASDTENVVSLFEPKLALDQAWPNLPFEKVDAERASLIIGMFIDGSLMNDTDAVITRITKDDLLRKLVDFVIGKARPEYRIVRSPAVSAWLLDQAKPALARLQEAAGQYKIVLQAQKEFAELIGDQLEVVGPHLQQLHAIYQKHKQAHPMEPPE